VISLNKKKTMKDLQRFMLDNGSDSVGCTVLVESALTLPVEDVRIPSE
jgi:hypothetical protein